MTSLFAPLTVREFWNGDCLDLMRDIPDESVDMILCDLPYGTTACSWDSIIPFEPMWEQYRRVIKRNGAIVLTAQQPFTSALIMSQTSIYRYNWIWDKGYATGHANANKMPMKGYEDVAVFYKALPVYNPQGVVDCPPRLSKGNAGAALGKNGLSGTTYVQTKTGYPKGIISTKKEYGTFHPTQKPVALFEYLIKTYTNPGETVLDNCAGSGTTAVAAINTGRGYICIERDPEYYARATERVKRHER